MKVTLRELKNYIRNAMSPQVSDREQLKFMGKSNLGGGVLQDTLEDEDLAGEDLTIDPGPRELGTPFSDPYVTQDRPAPTAARPALKLIPKQFRGSNT